MTGGEDPECRKCMVWDEEGQNTSLKNFVKQFIQLRLSEEAFTQGKLSIIEPDNEDDCFHFVRTVKNTSVHFFINTSDQSVKTSLDCSSTEYAFDLWNQKELNIKEDKLDFELPANDFVIIKQRNYSK